MSLLKGDDFRTVNVEAVNVATNVLVARQVDAVSGETIVTGTLSLASFSGTQPQNYGSIVGVYNGLNVQGANGYPGQIVSFASFVSNNVTNFPITRLGPLEEFGAVIAPISGITGAFVGGQLLCVGPKDWRLLSTAGISVA